MSKFKEISSHDDALSIYLDDMLYESSADIPKKPSISVEESVIENWKASPFQALLFDVNGLQLALHCQDAKAILPWPEAELAQRNEAQKLDEAVLGIYQQAPYQTTIIDAPYIFLPAELRHNADNASFIIIIGDGQWALSCHKINAIITLSPEDIKWRKNAGTRPWLSGTSVEKGCSIVNIDELVKLLI